MVMLQLDPTIPVTIPQGKGFAILVTDMGQEHHHLWTIVLDDTGEIWTVPNPDVRVRPNITMQAPRIAPVEKA